MDEEIKKYNKLVFVSRENIVFSPMAEWTFRSMVNDRSKEIISRGLIVLFEEPQSEIITKMLMGKNIKCNVNHVSKAFDIDEIDDKTLILTMDFAQKVRIIEKWKVEENVFTLHEFAGVEGEVLPVKTLDREAYEEKYEEIRELLVKVKEKLGWE